MHLPDECTGQGEILTQPSVHLDLRRTAERTERRAGVEGNGIAEVRRHRVPSLTKQQVHAGKVLTHLQAVPSEGYICLTQTELGYTRERVSTGSFGTQAGIEVRFDLTAELRVTPFIAHDVKSHAGGHGEETEGGNGVQILALHA